MTTKEKYEEIRKEVKENLLSGNFDVVDMSTLACMNCLGFDIAVRLCHSAKSVDLHDPFIRNEIPVSLNSEEAKTLYSKIMDGGYDLIIEQRTNHIKAINKEIEILQALRSKSVE